MRRRGDLGKTSFSFTASLPAPGPNAREKGLGMEVIRSAAVESKALLLVTDVDKDPCQSTPVSEWNMREDRRAHRSKEEVRASLAIKPGDKICAVNGMHGDDAAMAEMLASAADLDSPKAVNLTLERARSDVLGPLDELCCKLPPKMPTSGVRSRSNSNPDARYLPARPSDVLDDTCIARGRRGSEPAVSHRPPPQWMSMLSAASPPQMRGRQKGIDYEASTRSPSVSLSGRSSSASYSDNAPPAAPRSLNNFARIGRATFS